MDFSVFPQEAFDQIPDFVQVNGRYYPTAPKWRLTSLQELAAAWQYWSEGFRTDEWDSAAFTIHPKSNYFTVKFGAFVDDQTYQSCQRRSFFRFDITAMDRALLMFLLNQDNEEWLWYDIEISSVVVATEQTKPMIRPVLEELFAHF